MTENIPAVAKPKLPRGFVDRLKGVIPMTDDRELYALLAGDNPFSEQVGNLLADHSKTIEQQVVDRDSSKRMEDMFDLLREWLHGYVAT